MYVFSVPFHNYNHLRDMDSVYIYFTYRIICIIVQNFRSVIVRNVIFLLLHILEYFHFFSNLKEKTMKNQQKRPQKCSICILFQL